MSLNQKAVYGATWSFLTQFGHQVFAFVVSIVLARLLEPKSFGMLALMTVFIGVGQVLTNGGLGASLIRKSKVSQVEYSTIFYVNILVSVLLYVMLFGGSPLVGYFFDQPELVPLLRIYGLVFIIGSLSLIQNIRLTKDLNFKTHFKLTWPSLFMSGILSIYLAWKGFGVWSLVTRELAYYSLITLQYWLYGNWRPTLEFSRRAWREHFNFGYKIALSEVLKKFSSNLYNLLIGKFVGINQLGYYNRAKSLEQRPSGFIFSALNKVLYPFLSALDSSPSGLKVTYRRVIRLVALVVLPVLVAMLCLAKELVVVLLTEKWLSSVPILRILLLAAIFSAIQKYFLNIAKVRGRSDLVLQITVIQFALAFLTIIPLHFLGIYGLLWALVGVALLHSVYSGWRIGRLIAYDLTEQFRDLRSALLLSLFCGLMITLLREFWAITWPNAWQRLLGLGAFYCLFYFITLYLTRPSAFVDLKSLVRRSTGS